jgi:arylsulfatase A-like enzyme
MLTGYQPAWLATPWFGVHSQVPVHVPMLAERLAAPHHSLRSIRRGDWKYIEHVGQLELAELYHLSAQAVYETDNQVATEPALAQELRQAIASAFPRQQFLPYIAH